MKLEKEIGINVAIKRFLSILRPMKSAGELRSAFVDWSSSSLIIQQTGDIPEQSKVISDRVWAFLGHLVQGVKSDWNLI